MRKYLTVALRTLHAMHHGGDQEPVRIVTPLLSSPAYDGEKYDAPIVYKLVLTGGEILNARIVPCS